LLATLVMDAARTGLGSVLAFFITDIYVEGIFRFQLRRYNYNRIE
jgi:hypothetical protein